MCNVLHQEKDDSAQVCHYALRHHTFTQNCIQIGRDRVELTNKTILDPQFYILCPHAVQYVVRNASILWHCLLSRIPCYYKLYSECLPAALDADKWIPFLCIMTVINLYAI
jgi:hypothetical protein